MFSSKSLQKQHFSSPNLICNEVREVNYSHLIQSQPSGHCLNSASGKQLNSNSHSFEHEIQGRKSSNHQKRSLKKEKVKTDKMKHSGSLQHFITEIKSYRDERKLTARNHKFKLDCKSI